MALHTLFSQPTYPDTPLRFLERVRRHSGAWILGNDGRRFVPPDM